MKLFQSHLSLKEDIMIQLKCYNFAGFQWKSIELTAWVMLNLILVLKFCVNLLINLRLGIVLNHLD